MNKILKLVVLIISMSFVLNSCDRTIHEYPKFHKTTVILEPRIDREAPLYYKEVIYSNKCERTVNKLEEVPSLKYEFPEGKYKLRIVLDIYKGDLKKNASTDEKSVLIKREIKYVDWNAQAPQTQVSVDLDEGNYYVLGWADYVPSDKLDESAYRVEGLYTIHSNIDNYPSDIHLKDCASGNQAFGLDYGRSKDVHPFLLSGNKEDIKSNVIPVYMSRPVARYRVMALDYQDFLNNGGSLEGATAKIVYKKFISTGFNAYSQEPNEFITTYTVNMKLNSANYANGEIYLLSDYIFNTKDNEDVVLSDIIIYDAKGYRVNSCSSLDIPLKRNHETVIKGYFLTRKIGKDNDIKIDENFEGEYTVHWDY